MLRRRVATLAHVGRVGRDAGVHLILEVRVALHEARAAALADPQQVVEHQHLAVGRGPGADADHRHVDQRHQLLGDGRRNGLEHDREAARLLQRQHLLDDPRGAAGTAALGAVAAQRGRGLGRQADVAHHRDPGLHDRSGARDRRRVAALELDRVGAALLDEPHRGAHRLLVGLLVGAERQVGDQERACAGRGARRA